MMAADQSDEQQPAQIVDESTQNEPTGATQVQRHQSDKGIADTEKHQPTSDKAKSTSFLPLDAEAKKALQHHNEIQPGVGRTSTQLSRKGHNADTSEWDRRYDGPYGRPSITMVRRTSTQHGEEERPPLPTGDDAEGGAIQLVGSGEFQPEPPPLNYDLWSRKWWILFFWALVLFDTVVCPIALYFGLHYGLEVHGRMSSNTLFSIVTAAVGGASILEYFLRLWKLVRKKSTCRVIGAKWWHLDFFHWNFTGGWLVVMIELIVGTVQEHPPPRLITMVVPTMLYVFAVELLVADGLRYFEKPAPIRISSVPQGAQVRPGIYSIIEDVVSVDGSGGTTYREALNVRYESSHLFRAMLRRLGLFWSIGSMVTAVLCTILIFTVELEAAYTIGWTVPFVWAGIWALATIWYVKKKLREEKIAWAEEIAEKT